MMNDTRTSTSETARRAMVASQLRTNSVTDARVIEAMATVPRERFIPDSDATLAYRDRALPLPGGRAQNAPMTTGRLLTEAAIGTGDRVLLIGAAGGYTAAVLAAIAAEVVAVESDAVLAALARETLAGIANVALIEGALTEGAADRGPFDVLLIDGAVEHVPDVLAHQLRRGGRAVAGLVENGVTRLASGVRSGDALKLVPFADVDCVILPGFLAGPRAFHFPG